MSYIPFGDVSVINPVEGSEKEGDLRITTINSVKVVLVWLDGSWKQIYPAVFA
jgi:hypothetical protein